MIVIMECCVYLYSMDIGKKGTLLLLRLLIASGG